MSELEICKLCGRRLIRRLKLRIGAAKPPLGTKLDIEEEAFVRGEVSGYRKLLRDMGVEYDG